MLSLWTAAKTCKCYVEKCNICLSQQLCNVFFRKLTKDNYVMQFFISCVESCWRTKLAKPALILQSSARIICVNALEKSQDEFEIVQRKERIDFYLQCVHEFLLRWPTYAWWYTTLIINPFWSNLFDELQIIQRQRMNTRTQNTSGSRREVLRKGSDTSMCVHVFLWCLP